MKQRRFHPDSKIANHPIIQTAFKTIGALLIATKGKDLEADFMMSDETGSMRQFHVEVTEVQQQ